MPNYRMHECKKIKMKEESKKTRIKQPRVSFRCKRRSDTLKACPNWSVMDIRLLN